MLSSSPPQDVTPWSTALLLKPAVNQLIESFPKLYRNRRFINVFTKNPPLDFTLNQVNQVHNLSLNPF
jgi:hypothetical protein